MEICNWKFLIPLDMVTSVAGGFVVGMSIYGVCVRSGNLRVCVDIYMEICGYVFDERFLPLFFLFEGVYEEAKSSVM